MEKVKFYVFKYVRPSGQVEVCKCTYDSYETANRVAQGLVRDCGIVDYSIVELSI